MTLKKKRLGRKRWKQKKFFDDKIVFKKKFKIFFPVIFVEI